MLIPGHRSNSSQPLVPQGVLESFRELPVANISDNMNRLHGTRALKPYHRQGALAGTAVTVKTRPGDNRTLHEVYELLRPGDVLVVDGAGDLNQALVGEIMLARAKAIGVAGFVIDGAIRDVAAFRAGDFPCYARGVTHRGPYKSGPGEINVPVCIDGMVVMPGDLVLGDDDGVIAFPVSVAEELLALVRKQQAREADALVAIGQGHAGTSYIGVSALGEAKGHGNE